MEGLNETTPDHEVRFFPSLAYKVWSRTGRLRNNTEKEKDAFSSVVTKLITFFLV